MTDPTDSNESEFAAEARKKQSGFFGETWHFLRHNKKWWLTPVVLIVIAVGVVVLLSSGPAAPFIYTLF